MFDQLGYLNLWFGQAAPDYNWFTDGWKSAYSFNNIQQWGRSSTRPSASPRSYPLDTARFAVTWVADARMTPP